MEKIFGGLAIGWVIFVSVMFIGFIRHLIWVVGYALTNLDTISTGEAILMVGGTLAAPIGAIHGLILLF